MAANGDNEASARLVASAVLAAIGATIASYLAANQFGAIARVWDPVFGSASSQAVLHSWLSRALPVPDAALGAASYLIELGLAAVLLVRGGGAHRPWLAVTYGALAIAMAIAGVALVAIQAISIRSYCSLCLLSAAISWVLAALAFSTLTSGIRAFSPPGRMSKTT